MTRVPLSNTAFACRFLSILFLVPLAFYGLYGVVTNPHSGRVHGEFLGHIVVKETFTPFLGRSRKAPHVRYGPTSVWYHRIGSGTDVLIPYHQFIHPFKAIGYDQSSFAPDCRKYICIKEHLDKVKFNCGGSDYEFTSPQMKLSIIQDNYGLFNLYQSRDFLVATVQYYPTMFHAYGQHTSYIAIWKRGASDPVLVSKIKGEVRAVEIEP